MSLVDDLGSEVTGILRGKWSVRHGREIPETDDLQLGNDAVRLDGTVLYADLAESTNLVNNYKAPFAAEVYKCYLLCASKIITAAGGAITAFDGDRVMGVFIGEYKNTSAAICALKINHAVVEIIKPAIAEQYSDNTFELKHSVGVDTSTLFIARTGIRGSNDLVWVGRAANYAAKLCSLRNDTYASWITDDVYKRLDKKAKYGGRDGKTAMWEARTWTARNKTIYRSSWMWSP